MKSNNRIIANTFILYAKIIICMVISLLTVPMVIQALGQSDYGLYNLVAGVIAMLAFLNASMTVVTQRYMSVTLGSGDFPKLNAIYNAGLRIHIILGLFIVLILEVLAPFLFGGLFNIPSDRVRAAEMVYQFMVVSTFFSIISVPFDAVLNAYENMLAFSLISIGESLLKLLLAILLLHIGLDRLIVYGFGIAIISVCATFIRAFIVCKKYKDIRINFRLKIEKVLFNKMLSYAGWNTFGSFANVVKNQGIAVLLNRFEGTVINAAYGVANQINGVVSSFTATIQKAVSPQLMQREGANQRSAMFEMSFSLVKIATIIFALMAIPLIIEMDQVLRIWLHHNVPNYTTIFCQLILLAQLLFQLSSGVALTIDAVGKIGPYRLVMSIVILSSIPLSMLLLKKGYSPSYVLLTMVFVEIGCLIVRLYFAHKTGDFPVTVYLKKCLLPLIAIIVISFAGGFLINTVMAHSIMRLVLVLIISDGILLLGSYYGVLNQKEKGIIISFVKGLKKRNIED